MDLSRAFGCIHNDLLIEKLSAYGLKGNALKYIHTYLKNHKQCVRIDAVCSDIISGVSQNSIAEPISFKNTLKAFDHFKNKQKKCIMFFDM